MADDASGLFYISTLKGYGGQQCIVTDLSDIYEKWVEGKDITSCTSIGSTYYIVMTEKVVGYHGQAQRYHNHKTWSEIETAISDSYKDNEIITGICYNRGLQEYLVVTTESDASQSFEWMDSRSRFDKWMDYQYQQEDNHPTIVFKDPNFDQILLVMTSDEHRTGGYTACWNFPLI